MSVLSLRSSHVAAWTLSVLAVPVLYVLSMGVIWYADGRGKLQDPVPHWISAYSLPFRWMQDRTPLKGVLEDFALWCHLKGRRAAERAPQHVDHAF